MRVPHIVRIGALVLATTGVLCLCRPDGASEGSSASSGDRAENRPDHGRHGQGRPRDHGGQGTLLHLPHDRQDRGAPVPRPRGGRCPRGEPRPGPERCRVPRPIDVRTRRFIVPGFNPGMPAINKPPIGLTDQEILCVIAYLQTLGGTPTVTLQTTHSYYAGRDGRTGRGSRLQTAPPAARSGPGAAQRLRHRPAEGRGATMNILVVLAVARRVRAPSLPSGQSADVGRRLVGGDLRPPPIRIHCPDSLLRRLALHGNRLDCDPGVRVLQPGAPRRSLPPARPVHDGEAVHAAPRRNGRRHPGARGRERLRPDERPPRASLLPANGPSCIASRDHGSRQEDRYRRRRQPLPASRDVESGRVPQTCRERAPGLLPELRLLPRRQHGRQRHVRARAGPDPDQLRRRGHDRESSRDVSVLADLPREAPGCPKKAAPGTRPCRPGRSS